MSQIAFHPKGLKFSGDLAPANFIEFNAASSVTLPENVQIIGGGITNTIAATEAGVIAFEFIGADTTWASATISSSAVTKIVIQDLTEITSDLFVSGANTTLVDIRNATVNRVFLDNSGVNEFWVNRINDTANGLLIRGTSPAGGTLDVYGDYLGRVRGTGGDYTGTGLNLNVTTIGVGGISISGTSITSLTSTATACDGGITLLTTPNLADVDFISCALSSSASVELNGCGVSTLRFNRTEATISNSGILLRGCNPVGGILNIIANYVGRVRAISSDYLGTALNINAAEIGIGGVDVRAASMTTFTTTATTVDGAANLSGCALIQTSVDGVLNHFATGSSGSSIASSTKSLNLSGGTSSSPTGGASNADKLALEAVGWAVNVN